MTPAISVLSAVEGLDVVAPALERWVIPLTVAILIGLFVVQRAGTARVGRLFGPVMFLWFSTLAILGIVQIVQEPGVLRALSPLWAFAFAAENGWLAFVALGSVVLAVTGGEALYVDMGHFGRLPIRLAWLGFVLPALLLNYMGQGALLLRDPSALENPFYHLAPAWGQIPLLMLATMATVIASQAVISGTFSISRQAVQLGLIPRLGVRHTSEEEIGQVYVPKINWTLCVLVIGLVLGSSPRPIWPPLTALPSRARCRSRRSSSTSSHGPCGTGHGWRPGCLPAYFSSSISPSSAPTC